jgi:DUF1009 family protein
MSGTRGALGIIGGGGELPIAIAHAALASGRSVFVVGIEGLAKETELARFPHGFAGLGELGKMLRLLKDAQCSEVTFAGRVPRPKITEVKFDTRGALALPKLVAAARQGDDALLRAVLGVFAREGLTIIGSDEAARELVAGNERIGSTDYRESDSADIARGFAVVRAMGALDIGQAAVVCEGLVLAVEAAEGTDEMLRRVAVLPETLRGRPEARRGVLVKAAKPGQERRVDLPVIGLHTIELAAAAGLSGIALESGSVLIMNRRAIRDAADRAGIFVVALPVGDAGP